MSYHQLTISVPSRLHARLIELCMRNGSLGIIEHEESLVAFFPHASDISSLREQLNVISELFERSSARQKVSIVHRELPELDWNESWKKNFKPVPVGNRFSILPPWEKAPRGRVPLIIDPGMAFGTGHHETTRSCLVLMEKYAGSVQQGRFLDLGTGTGLLAVAARKLGFKNVVGLDTDPLAIKAARKNRTLNKATGIVLREGGIDLARGVFGMIAANLIAGTLIELARPLAEKTSPSGIAIMSGILQGQDAEVVRATKKAGLILRERLRDGKWVSLVCSR